MSTTYSFHINGFWYHLHTTCCGNLMDQYGMFWTRQERSFISICGGMVYTEPDPVNRMNNKDFFMYERESRFAFHKQRMILNKTC